MLELHQKHTDFSTIVDDIEDDEDNHSFLKQPIIINGYKVYQFSLQGTLLLNKVKDKTTIDHSKKYIEGCICNTYDIKKNDLPLKKARVFIQHFYSNYIIRDLDNRNHKLIIDALRYACIIQNDSWQHLSLDISGHKDDTDHVQIYVVDDQYKYEFGQYLEKNSNKLKQKPLPFNHKQYKNGKNGGEKKKIYQVKDDEYFW